MVKLHLVARVTNVIPAYIRWKNHFQVSTPVKGPRDGSSIVTIKGKICTKAMMNEPRMTIG